VTLPSLHRYTRFTGMSAWRIADTAVGIVRAPNGQWLLVSLGRRTGSFRWLAANGLMRETFPTRRQALMTAAAIMEISPPPRLTAPQARRAGPGEYVSPRGHFRAVRGGGVVRFAAVTAPARDVKLPAPAGLTRAQIAQQFALLDARARTAIRARRGRVRKGRVPATAIPADPGKGVS